MSQKGIEDGSKYGHGQDSIDCLMNLSLYLEFFKHGNYKDAIGPWRKVFAECPASRQSIYVDGVKMYKKFISGQKNPEVAEGLIDTLMLIYDRRMEYFDDRANVLSRKATDLLKYRQSNLEAVQEAYKYIDESITLDKNETRDATVILYINSSIALYRSDIIDQNQTIDDYFGISEIIDMNLKKNSKDKRWLEARETVDGFMLKEGILTCDALNKYYEPKFEANKNDMAFLDKVIDFYNTSGCDRSDMFASASVRKYEINPDADAAYKLARMFVVKEDYEQASHFYKEAVSGDADNETKAKYYYELAQVTRVRGQICECISYAREAVKLNPNYGDAYILLGDAYIESRTNLGEDFEQKTAFWAAADKYIKAKNVDPMAQDVANKRLNDYAEFYPDAEQCFFRTLKEGDSYEVKGCINEYTTVRPRK